MIYYLLNQDLNIVQYISFRAAGAAITALIILFHFTVGVFLADRKFSFDVILKSPPFYTIIFSVILLYYRIELPVFVENTTFLLMYATIFLILMSSIQTKDFPNEGVLSKNILKLFLRFSKFL